MPARRLFTCGCSTPRARRWKSSNSTVKILFVRHPNFEEKCGVYTYTEEEEKKNPEHVSGTGHEDNLFLNTIFQKAIVAFGEHTKIFSSPDIVNCHDATAAMVPAFIHESLSAFFQNTKCIVTIHNAGPGYHHAFPDADTALAYTGLSSEIVNKARNGKCVEPFLIGCQFASMSTVSPQYAADLLNPLNSNTDGLSKAFASGGITITGITNGIDYTRYDPSNTLSSKLPYTFDPSSGNLEGKYHCRTYFLNLFSSDGIFRYTEGTIKAYGFIEQEKQNEQFPVVYIVYHGRVVQQKGIDVFEKAAAGLLDKYGNVRFLAIGQGTKTYEEKLIAMAKKYPGKFFYLKGYDRAITRLCTAASDFIVLPSNFEPCGLEDFIAQIYGTIPVAHATGGLKKIVNGKTGYLYEPNTVERLTDLLSDLIETKTKTPSYFDKVICTAATDVKNNRSWSTVVKKYYLPFFHKIIEDCLT